MATCKYNPGINSVNPYAVLTVTQGSQNIAENKTTVNYTLKLYRASEIRAGSVQKDYSISINGSRVKTGTTTITGTGTKTIASGSVEVPHNSDGTKTINFSFGLEFAITWSGVWIGTGTANGSMTLKTIPRATTPTLSPASVNIGSSMTISLPRASSSFTHTLTYKFGGLTGTIGSSLGASASWTVPTTFTAEIPNSASGKGTITCKTYNGSTLIGSKNISFTARVPTSVVPSISTIAVSETVSGLAAKFGGYVQTKSKPQISITATGAQGSTIKSYSTKLDGKTYSGGTFTADEILTSGSVQISVTVTDSRGRTATKTQNITVLAYAQPTIVDFRVVRANSSGTEDEEGTYALATINFSISPVSSKNTGTYKVEYKQKTGSVWSTAGTWSAYSYNGTRNLGNILNADYSYDFRLTVTDYFGSVEAEDGKVSSTFSLFDVNKSGKSIAFGGVSDRGENESAVDFKIEAFDKFGTRINNGMARYTGSGDSAIDPDTTSDELILTNLKTPISGNFMYITTVFYGDKTSEAPRAQTAIPCSAKGSMYHRYYYNGAWSDWRRHVNADENQKILWSGKYYMNGTQTITLSEAISAQKSGIVLVFSSYVPSTATANDFDWFECFVSKQLVKLQPGKGHQFGYTHVTGSFSYGKYLYINDTTIEGHANNVAVGTGANGVKYENNRCVLRYVIGV